jgi:purine-nucleoside phosphorylase
MTGKIRDIADFISKKIRNFVPDTAIILGSGLGGFENRISPCCTVDFSEIENFPRTSVKGHKGRFIFAEHKNRNIVIMSGRVHYYEGFPMHDVVLPIRVLKLLGIKNLIVTNAAGGIKDGLNKGDIMLIKNHIGIFCPNPLIGANPEEFGERFPDMTYPYDFKLSEIARRAALKAGVELKEGVYCYLTGPSYESAADIAALRAIGADAVGMSTVPEVIAARHCGVRVCGFSYIANKAAGLTEKALCHNDILNSFNLVQEKFYGMLDNMIEESD